MDTADDQMSIDAATSPPTEEDGAPTPDVSDNPIDGPPPLGIQDNDQAPEPASMFIPVNGWIGKVGDHYVHVWAGSSGIDRMIGMVEIATLDQTGDNIVDASCSPVRAAAAH